MERFRPDPEQQSPLLGVVRPHETVFDGEEHVIEVCQDISEAKRILNGAKGQGLTRRGLKKGEVYTLKVGGILAQKQHGINDTFVHSHR